MKNSVLKASWASWTGTGASWAVPEASRKRFWASWAILEVSRGFWDESQERLGPSWKRLGLSWKRLGASRKRLGASWTSLGRILGASCAAPGASCGRPGPLLDRLGGQDGQGAKKSRFSEASWTRLGLDFGKIIVIISCVFQVFDVCMQDYDLQVVKPQNYYFCNIFWGLG